MCKDVACGKWKGELPIGCCYHRNAERSSYSMVLIMIPVMEMS